MLASDTKLLSEGEGGIRESATKLLEDESLRMIVETEGRLEATSRLSDLAKQATLRTAAMEARTPPTKDMIAAGQQAYHVVN